MNYTVYVVKQLVEFDCSITLCVFYCEDKAEKLAEELNNWLENSPELPYITGDETDEEYNQLYKQVDYYNSTRPVEKLTLRGDKVVIQPLEVIV